MPTDFEQNEESLIQEVLEYVGNDISPVQDCIYLEPDIEEDHYEDTYQENRLNKDIDINNIDMEKLMALIERKERTHNKIDEATFRKMCAPRMLMRVQMDSGANRSITPYKDILHNITKVKPFGIDGINGSVEVDTVGYLKLHCTDDSHIWVRTYYSPDVEETIISHTDITLSKDNSYVVWDHHSNTLTKEGQLTFSTQSGLDKAVIALKMINSLWYMSQPTDMSVMKYTIADAPVIRNLTQQAEYALWHQGLGHIGEKAMANMHKCVEGTPNLMQSKNKFFKCECCMRGKITAAPKNKQSSPRTTARGQLFHMDFGFVRGTEYKSRNEKGTMVTSRDGYNSYLIIVDSYTRYAWVFLSATKDPPLNTVRSFLNRYGLTTGTQRQIRCDQGGELARSAKFRETVQACGYSIEPTGADNSSQN